MTARRPVPGDLSALVRALGVLLPDGATAAEVAGALSFTGGRPAPPASGTTPAVRLTGTTAVAPHTAASPPRPPEPADPPAAPDPRPEPSDPLLITLRPIRRRTRGRSLRPGGGSAPPPPADQPDDRAASTPAGLFSPEWEARILLGLASVQTVLPVVDVTAAVASAAALEVTTRLPLLSRWKLGERIRLLLDVGPGMQPFAADLQQLRQKACRTVGDSRVDVRFFAGTPLCGAGLGARREWRPYVPPDRPSVVLVVSDFGASSTLVLGSADETEWRSLLESLRAAGHRVIGLTPYALDGVPGGIRRVVPIVSWSRRTGVRDGLRPERTRNPS